MPTHRVSSERLQQIESVLAAALEWPSGDRARMLDELYDGDPALHRDIESLLAFSAGGVFDEMCEEISAEIGGPEARQPELPPGTPIGRYRVVREIGRGGMGTVYLGERDDGAFEQVVALKLLRHDLGAGDFRARFLAERQILARIDHPNIARLLDGGVTEDGQPFLAMEYVEGTRLDRFCDNRRLTIPERLDLFLSVCLAVEHVHGHLVVHRDIKPGNVFVTDDGIPKLLDFGIAKLLDSSAFAVDELQTQTAHRLYTPEYAAPEQIRGDPTTTATDVYQLGVLLFELLTGKRPFRVAGPSGRDLARRITETAAPCPSTCVRPEGRERDGAVAHSHDRGTSPDRLRRQLSGDLDNIVLKALRKEPERRYLSVGGLADDLHRFRRGLPVSARPDSTAYRLSRFVQRNRLTVAITAFILVAIIGFSANTAVQSARVTRERDRAQGLATMLTDLFANADPLFGNDTMTIGEFFDHGAERVETGFQGDPETQAAFMVVLGDVYFSLGRQEAAEQQWMNALELRRRLFGERSAEYAEVATSLASIRAGQGRHDEADTLARAAKAVLERAGPAYATSMGRATIVSGYAMQVRGALDSAEIEYQRAVRFLREGSPIDTQALATVFVNRGWASQVRGDLDGAEINFRQALRLRAAKYGVESPGLAPTLDALAGTMLQQGALDSAAATADRAAALLLASVAPPHPAIANNQGVRAVIAAARGHHAVSDSLFEEAVQGMETMFGAQTVAMASVSNHFAVALDRRGNLPRAAGLYRRSLGAYRASRGDAHTSTALVASNLAWVLSRQGLASEADSLFRRALDVLDHSELDPVIVAEPLRNYALLRYRESDYAGADTLFSRSIDLWRTVRPADDDDILYAQAMRGNALTRLGHYELAEAVLLETLAQNERKRGRDHDYTRGTARSLIDLYDRWGMPDKRDALNDKYQIPGAP